MSKPDIIPKTTASGIAVDPRTLDRVIPESRRPDGTVRKEIKIRPGFTPQEDVSRFRGSRQQQMDRNTLPKGHIIGWAPPSAAAPAVAKPLSKSAKKNAKRKEKRDEKKADDSAAKIKDSWEDEDEDDAPTPASAKAKEAKDAKEGEAAKKDTKTDDAADALAEEVQKLDVR
ncbi:Mago-bind domain-containing protein [Phanerochaete sordida]|uniref:Mago-bind domain-containing protein n=1 Tax=Phanerochaete sordida TaxID=48140 RepID=A0A9P3FX23_9APHY|nr:Mago-bind domain-containing protein [Phanerochaete sordida]